MQQLLGHLAKTNQSSVNQISRISVSVRCQMSKTNCVCQAYPGTGEIVRNSVHRRRCIALHGIDRVVVGSATIDRVVLGSATIAVGDTLTSLLWWRRPPGPDCSDSSGQQQHRRRRGTCRVGRTRTVSSRVPLVDNRGGCYSTAKREELR